MSLRNDADRIISAALDAALPDTAVKKALEKADFGKGRLVLVAAGKAAWQMSKTASDILGERISDGVVVTKYNHSKGPLPYIRIFEAGHPVPDENSFRATDAAIEAVQNLTKEDTVLFLVSGGGSALFEKPLITGEELNDLTKQLLSCGADIVEMNTIRKRMSAVKGGRFAEICAPAHVFSIILSDIIGDPLDMIASGPTYPDSSTCEQALRIVEKYHLSISEEMASLLRKETPKQINNVETHITGSVRQLCMAAETACREMGYETTVLTASLSCVAREAGTFLANIAQFHQDSSKSKAFIVGGETVVHLTGRGKGGRNQELALAAAPGIAGMEQVAVFSVGSDGTDGPTDAAGGFVDGNTAKLLENEGIDVFDILNDNNAYYALEKSGGLIKTGPTGTNVNDISVVLIKR